MVSKRSRHSSRRPGHPPCPHCDQPDTSLLRLVLVGEILRAEESQLALLADLVQQMGLLHFSARPTAPPRRRQQGTVHRLRRPEAERQ
jgi:hypothetical protein